MPLKEKVLISFLMQDHLKLESQFHSSHLSPSYCKRNMYGLSDIKCNFPLPPLSLNQRSYNSKTHI